jgi:predicted enzyme related to lactoylglutathione lyase
MAIKGSLTAVDHVNLSIPPGAEEVADAFYLGIFGLSSRPKPAEIGGRWYVGSGFEIHLGSDPSFSPASRAHPAFRVVGLADLAERLKAGGAKIDEEYRESRLVRAFTYDPFGNRIELMESD